MVFTFLLVFVYWVYMFFFYLAAGIIFRELLAAWGFSHHKTEERRTLFLSIFSGIAVTAILLQTLSLFFPLNSKLHLIVSLILVLLLILFKRLRARLFLSLRSLPDFRKFGVKTFLFPMMVFLVFCYATLPISPYDSGLYHIQTVELARDYSVIPGIGNLHDRLAFNNSWLLNVAFFSIGPLAEKPYLTQNSFVLFLLYAYILSKLFMFHETPLNRAGVLRLIFFGLAGFFFFRFPLFVSSVSPDTPSYILTFFILSEILFPQRKISAEEFLCLFLIFCLSVTIKFSSIFSGLMLIPWLFLYLYSGNKRKILIFGLSLIALFNFLPFFARNYFQSGYLVYPLYMLDIFHPEWKILKGVAEEQMTAIKGWARYPASGYEQTVNQPLGLWVSNWYGFYADSPLIKFIVFSLALSPLIFISVLRTKVRASLTTTGLLLFAINLAWFFTAPDPRFAYGSATVLCCGVVCAAIYQFLSGTVVEKIDLNRKPMIAFVSILMISIPLFSLRGHFRNLLLNPGSTIPEYPQVNLESKKLLSGERILVPAKGGMQCWNWSPLCTPYLHKGLVFRGKNLQEGFKIMPDGKSTAPQ